jgi:hypothetical protein
VDRVESLIVIVPDALLRRSVVFLLEAEGYRAQPHESIEHAARTGSARQRCAVVDDASIGVTAGCWEELGELADEIVLLHDRAPGIPAGVSVHAVAKPLLGDRLVASVRAALRHPAAST